MDMLRCGLPPIGTDQPGSLRCAAGSVRVNRAEQTLQIQVADYLTWALAPPWRYTAFPSGGGGLQRGRALKRMGLKRGPADLLLFGPGARLVQIELKTAKRVVSEAQREWHAAMTALDFEPTIIARSLDAVRAALAAAGVPLRETKPAQAAFAEGIARGSAGLAEPIFPETDRVGARKRRG